jgi:NADH dehydrogenase [ubiquinone] 1 alpha subcomplex assembly factor 7
MASSIEAVYLVEASPALRDAQKNLLCGDAPMTETSIGHQSISKYANIPIIWADNIRFIPSGQLIPKLCQHHLQFQVLIKALLSSHTNSLTHSPSTPSNPSPHQTSLKIPLKLPQAHILWPLKLPKPAKQLNPNGEKWSSLPPLPTPPTLLCQRLNLNNPPTRPPSSNSRFPKLRHLIVSTSQKSHLAIEA